MTIDQLSATESAEHLRAIRSILETWREPVSGLIERDSFAALMSLGVSTFDRLRASGKIGPAEVRIGGGIRWHRQEVEAWLAHRSPSGELHDSETWPTIWADLQRQARKK